MQRVPANRRAAELVASSQSILYCFPRADALTTYLRAFSPRFIDLAPETVRAIVSALANQLAQRKLARPGIDALVHMTVTRCIRAHSPDMPRHHAEYVLDHYAKRVVRYAVALAPRELLPPVCLATHFSETGIFVME